MVRRTGMPRERPRDRSPGSIPLDSASGSLLLTANFPPRLGGTCRLFWELYRRAPPGRVRVAAGTRPDAALRSLAPHLPIASLPLDFEGWAIASARGWRAYRAAGRALRRELGRQRPAAAVHAGRLLPEGWLALGSGARFACWVHGEELVSIASSRQLRWMARRVLRRATVLFANSRHTARMLNGAWGVAAEKVEVLPPGVDCAWFTPAAPDPSARAALGWGAGAGGHGAIGDRPVALTVARLEPRKGHDRMLDAVALLRREHRDLLWAVVGGDPDGGGRLGALTRQAAAAGLAENVRFHGALDERALRAAYQQCDLFVLPNREVEGDFEGFGMVLLEAQACGRPVIAGASGGTAEAMRDGESGFIVDCGDARALAGALARLLGDPARRRALGARGREVALEHDWSRRVEEARAAWDRWAV